MSAWTIYDKGGSVKCEAHRLEYSGEFLGACSVNVSITSPTPIAFEIGDYITYREERFELNYDPSVVKESSSGNYGEGFVYDNVVFNSLSDELTRCDFLDYVPSDNEIHYSSLPTFSFHADSVRDLAERIQANLDRVYNGGSKWAVNVHSGYTDTKDANISVSNMTCWDALALVKSQFNANFIIRGRTITIGTSGIAVGSIFSYGKGNGLYKIERNAESDQKIVTRLRAYGSTRNMPSGYYRNLNLMVFATVDSITVNTGYFDGMLDLEYSDGLFTKDAYDAEGVSVTGKVVEVMCGDIEIRAKIIEVEDTGLCRLYAEYRSGDDEADEPDQSKLDAFLSSVSTGSRIYFTKFIDRKSFPFEHKEYANHIPNNMAVQNLMLPSFPVETLDPHIDSANIAELGVREGTVFFDGSGDLEEIYPTMEGMTAEELNASGIETSSEGALDVVVSAEQIEDNGEYVEGGDMQETFKVTIKDIGFDINDYLSAAGSPSISMKDGMCGGRDFEIVSCEKEGSGYTLTCKRTEDTGIGLFFPYSGYQIQSGDRFVLLNIEMPDVYVQAASQRLLKAATDYLAKNDYVRYSYTPTVDNIYMARQHDEAVASGGASIHDTIKEGDFFLFEDSDLGIEGSITIDSLSIKEYADESMIPEYGITLKDEKTVGTIQKIQNQISSIVNNGVAGNVNTEQVSSVVKAVGDRNFLSKTRDDRTPHKLNVGKTLTAEGGFETLGAIMSMLAGKGTLIRDGKIQADSLQLRDSLTVMEIIFNRLSAMESNYAFSAAATIESVEKRVDSNDNIYYRLTFRRRWDNDFHAFAEHDIIYGQFNDLADGGRTYYTSWMRVLEYCDTTTNQVDVVLWADDQVPTGVNYAPKPMMNVIHRGNVYDTDRQSYWSLSAMDEKCLVWLEGVDAPILRSENYYMMLGKPKNLQNFPNLPINYDHSYVYARGGIFQDLLRVDFQGVVLKTENNRGTWSAVVAESESPYKATDTSYDVVYHRGCKWRCVVSDTLDEPSYASQDWLMLEGDPNFYLDFESSMGWQFFRTQVNTDITAKVSHANEDITDILMAGTTATVVWSRDSGDETDDNTWTPTYVDGKANVIHLSVNDMGNNWGFSNRKVKFTCTVYIQDGDNYDTAENSITI